MNRLLKKFNRRHQIYLGIVALFFTAVLVQIGVVEFFRSSSIVSFNDQWDRYGKPVVVERVSLRDVPVYTRFTVTIKQGRTAAGFVTADIRDNLSPGQKVILQDGKAIGAIGAVGRDLDIDAGMFLVTVELSMDMPHEEKSIVVSAQTQLLRNVITVQNNILDIIDGKYYLWVVQDNLARMREVHVGLRNGFGAVVESGLDQGDLLIVNGAALLNDGDKVNIEAKND